MACQYIFLNNGLFEVFEIHGRAKKFSGIAPTKKFVLVTCETIYKLPFTEHLPIQHNILLLFF